MKYNCIIVDDEPIAGGFLKHYCEKQGTLHVAGTFENAADALLFLKEQSVDILFLDVEMPGLSGFELLDQLAYLPKVVLTTSKTDYAFNAFQYNVTDYLKKPISYSRFQSAVDKVTDSLSTAVKTPPALAGKKEDVFIKTDGKFVRLNYEDILYIESMGDYVKYCTSNKTYVTHSTLKAVEEKVEDSSFIKVHRSYIVNLKKIKDIQDNTLLIEGKVIPISKSLKSDVLQKIGVI
ncbi:MAG: LytTR family DNA-binding domain-containing protein [Ferruginibacter sp.]